LRLQYPLYRRQVFPQCCGKVEVDPSQEKAVCDYCGTTFLIEKAIKEYNVQNARIEHVDSVNIIKRGSVESAFSFVEKQLDKKQKQKEEEKRQQEEKEKEQKEKIIRFIKKHWKPLLAVLGAIVILIVIGSLSYTAPDHTGEMQLTDSSDNYKGKNYKAVMDALQTAGFTDVKTDVLDDLVTGWVTGDGSIEQVAINGDTDFTSNEWFPKDAKIIITYHTFPSTETEKVPETTETPEVTATTKVTETAESVQSTVGVSEEIAQETEEGILTVENNEDLAALLTLKNSSDPSVKAFAAKYAGRTIEFNGNIASMINFADEESNSNQIYMINYKDVDTRYDLLIYAGDYSKTSAYGPNLKFAKVNMSDLHLTGNNIPDSIGRGQNLRITAKVQEYNEIQDLFLLQPISLEIR